MKTDQMSKYYKLLRNIPVFKDLSNQDVEKICNLCHEERYSAGDVIFMEGSVADKFYIVYEGRVTIWKNYFDTEKDKLAAEGRGQLFGEMALIDELSRSATVTAEEDTSVIFIYGDDFFKIIQENNLVALSIMKSITAKIRVSNENFVADLRRQNRELADKNKKLEETQKELIQAEKLSTLGKFSSLILHDIRNPLSMLRGFAQMIRLNLDEPEKISKYADQIITETDRLNRLANELLDYSRGEIRLNISIVEIPAFLKKFLVNIQERFAARNIKISIKIGFKGPVLLDEERMLRVFINLANNARKAMSKGGEFSVMAQRAGNNLKFSVTDNGLGMSKAVLARIYEPFFSSSQLGGTGLGMSIVKSVVEAHDGLLHIESEERKGTKVIITLPIRN